MKLNLEFQHLKDVNQSYLEHAKDALTYACKLSVCVGKLVVHAVYPDIFTNDTSEECRGIYQRVVDKKNNTDVMDDEKKEN